jgi:hypothetical protein
MAHGMLGIHCLNVLAGADSGVRWAAADGLAGWCNGIAGLAAALAIRWASGSDAAHRRAAVEAAWASLDAHHDTDGLCHGTAGAVAVAAGVARVVEDDDLSKRALVCASSLSARLATSAMRLGADVHFDQTWLTGTSGAAWGLLVATKRPMVNPLLPIDSELITARLLA